MANGPGPIASVAGPARDERRFAACVALAFLGLQLVGALRHEVWRDEIQAWLLARDSATPLSLWRSMRYEGHPALWHLLLWPLTRLAPDPLSMQLLHALIATAGVWVMARWAPWGRGQRTLAALGYFSLFEYGVIARGYSLGLLLIYAFCALHPRRRERPWAPWVVLALLANTSIYGLLVALALAAALLIGDRPPRWQAGALVLAAGMAAAILQMRPAADAVHAAWRNPLSYGRAVSVARTFWRASVPLPSLREESFWCTNVLDGLVSLDTILVLSLLLLGLCVLALARRPRALACFLLGAAAIMAFGHLKFHGTVRHFGHLYVLWLATSWLADAGGASGASGGSRRDRWSAAVKGPLLWALLGAQAIAGLYAYQADLRRPFSRAGAAADFLASAGGRRLPLLAQPGWLGLRPVARLGGRAYHLDSQRWESYRIYRTLDTQGPEAQRAALPRARQLLASLPGAQAWLLLNWVPATIPAGLTLEPLAEFTGGIVSEEDCHLFLARLDPATPGEGSSP